MSEIEFYILSTDDILSLYSCVSMFCLNGIKEHKTISIMTRSQEELNDLGEYLWTIPSFVPSCLIETEGDLKSLAPVSISKSNHLLAEGQILINLSSHLLDNFAQYQQVKEFVFPEHHQLELARERYSFYKQRGYPIRTTHQTR